MKRNVLILLGILLSTFIMAGCSNSDGNSQKAGNTEAETVKINLGHALSEGTPAADLIVEMAENIFEETEGRVKIEVFPNSQLGSETEMLEQVQMGSMEAAAIMVGSMQSLDMRMAIEDLPYMWKDVEHARAAYEGEFGDYLANVMSEKSMTKIGYLEWGFRHITNNKQPIVEPEDMEGIKIRVAQTKLRVDAFEQLGSLPTIMAFSELYGALQQGVVDAQENPLANIVAPKFDEVQKYLSLTGHFYNTVMLVVNTDTWNKISPEDQEFILAEGKRISTEVQVENDSKEEEYIQELKDRGMVVNEDVNTEAFREKMLPVYDTWEKETFGKELMDIYREASGW